MKKLLFILAVAAGVYGCTPNKNAYTIDGTIEGLEGYVYLTDDEGQAIDSVTVENGVFRFKGIAEQPSHNYLRDRDTTARGYSVSVSFYLEPGTITVSGKKEDRQSTLVSGTPSNDASAAFALKYKEMGERYMAPETTDAEREAIDKEFTDFSRQSLDSNRMNLFGATLLAQNFAYELSGSEMIAEIAKFPVALQALSPLNKAREQAERKMKTEVGQHYINIMQSDADGKIITLASVVENSANKYILIDFWASWCNPCMGEVPVLVKTYTEFHKKGFEIYGVSFDKDKAKWQAAVTDKAMNWIQVSDLNGFDNPAAKEYAVTGIPSNFLVDAQGKIIATDLRGEALYEKIAELLK
ncbi:MAG: TlpA disulfide reductase family protein [Alistipes sp.]